MAIPKTLIFLGLALAFVLLIASEVSARELAQENGQEVDDFNEKGYGGGYGKGKGSYGGGYGKGKGGYGGGYGKGKGGYGGGYGKGKGGYEKGRGGYNKPGHGRYPPGVAGETEN